MRFEDFKVGDHVWFEKTFSPDDFKLFSELSGDRNPLHHDKQAAKASTFGTTIVPMHMIAAPLSRIAGMIFPGESSLYLGAKWRMPQPAYFSVATVYSARIYAISPAQRMLEIRTIAFQDRRVVFDAIQHVRARADEWKLPPELLIRHATEAKRVLVTGTAGEIGRAIALRLARAGFDLLLHVRRSDGPAENLARECQTAGSDVAVVVADLATEKGRVVLAKALQSTDDVGAIVHAASPGIRASLHDLVEVNFAALETIANAAIPGMLRRQAGLLLFIGSAGVETNPPDWESYVGAKTMSTNYMRGIDKAYGSYGIYSRVLAPGYVKTAMSEEFRPPDTEVLLPEEVADEVAKILAQPHEAPPYTSMRSGEIRRGQFGFASQDLNQPSMGPKSQRHQSRDGSPRMPEPTNEFGDLLPFVANFLEIGDVSSVREGGIDITAGWDSLRHIELMLAIEQQFGLRFSAVEIERSKTYRGLEKLVRDKNG